MKTLLTPLPYRADSAAVFARIAHRQWAIYLDSGWPGSQYGRYDIFSAEPMTTLATRDGQTEIRENKSTQVVAENPFHTLKTILQRHTAAPTHLPFSGGAMGYFSYDLARCLESLPERAMDAEQMPEMAIGIYDWAAVFDHRAERAWLIGQGNDARTREQWPELVKLLSEDAAPQTGVFKVLDEPVSNMEEADYAAAFERIKHYIAEGDCYQVNLAQRFSAQAEGDAWAAYLRLRQLSPAPFSAYFNTPHGQILSASPERFLRVENGRVETKPIKGTRPRSSDPSQDKAYADALQSSEKDRAENVMIVDLLRNDLGKNCATGSVHAEKLFALESFANVHHLVSTVTGTLAPDRDAVDLLQGCFPGGSITGTPKLRAMEIIEELEAHRRGVYCGAIGYIGFDKNMDTNIAIRTAVFSDNLLRFWAGGGIVADSEMQKEYRETLDKASGMLQLIAELRGKNVGC
ncbi:MAG: aminodeoxychorismate synthase component I [Methylobacillus sp.]|jgi:para-aminobenzoate synthetase component 1|nr:aminodeoxychorismate synthase component I [Methylobacillus sp.]